VGGGACATRRESGGRDGIGAKGTVAVLTGERGERRRVRPQLRDLNGDGCCALEPSLELEVSPRTVSASGPGRLQGRDGVLPRLRICAGERCHPLLDRERLRRDSRGRRP
jgi:hypothetical protein